VQDAGNINQLILKLESYAAALEDTQGVIAEFVNPKYKDASKQAFKSPTRLECMMQDFPRALPPSAAIGFTVINQVTTILPNVVEHMTVRRRVAGSIPVFDGSSACTLHTCSCGLCGYLGRNPGEGVN